MAEAIRAHDDELTRALAEHATRFAAEFGAGARGLRTFFSPGRVNLMGAHLDYNGGPVMPMAIDRGTFIALCERDDGRVRLRTTHGYASDDEGLELELAALPERRTGRWVDYPLGVLRMLPASRAPARGADILFGGNLPVGAGLSSSASICVGTAFALNRAWELGLEQRELVDIALRAEREFVGVRCGIMDPYAVGFAQSGALLWLDCKDASTAHLPLDHEAVSVAVADSGVRRELAQGAFNQRVAESARAFELLRAYAPGSTCLRDVPAGVLDAHEAELEPHVARRARHVVDEVRRTFAARDALARGDLREFGARMFETHRSLRDLYEVSVPELDTLVESAARQPAVYGARLTGAGFGGCAVIVVERGAREPALAAIANDFERRFGRRPAIEVFTGDAGPREVALG